MYPTRWIRLGIIAVVFTKDTYLSSYSYIRANGKEVDAATTTVKDVFINRDGEYTVGISGINLSASQKYNILQIATDLSVKTEKNGTGIYSGVNISNVSLKVDGVTVEQGLTPVLFGKRGRCLLCIDMLLGNLRTVICGCQIWQYCGTDGQHRDHVYDHRSQGGAQ